MGICNHNTALERIGPTQITRESALLGAFIFALASFHIHRHLSKYGSSLG